MAVLDPIKLVITNYPEGEESGLDENNQEDEVQVLESTFSRELYIEKDFLKMLLKQIF
jgi:glutaminyl-tRNA synthetase